MKRIFIGDKVKHNVASGIIYVDKIPPKSCYKDSNRSDIVVSKTFRAPDEDTLRSLYNSSKEFFKKTN